MKVIIDMGFIPLLHTEINASFYTCYSCKGLTLLPLSSNGVYKDNYL
jgi:hypothetical protein